MKNVIKHPDTDAALIRTNNEIIFTKAIQSIKLPPLTDENKVYDDYEAMTSGWGLTCKYMFYFQSSHFCISSKLCMGTCLKFEIINVSDYMFNNMSYHKLARKNSYLFGTDLNRNHLFFREGR
jgi:hypothetical protein